MRGDVYRAPMSLASCPDDDLLIGALRERQHVATLGDEYPFQDYIG